MKCPECVAAGERSRVYEQGGGAVTDMGFGPYYDEDGVRHVHDPNMRGRTYRCSNGHEWHESWFIPCPAGDWPQETDPDEGQRRAYLENYANDATQETDPE